MSCEEPERVPYLGLVCRREVFRPAAIRTARWLDPRGDFHLVRARWANSGTSLSIEEWLGFWDQGYEYCAVVEESPCPM